jgi:deoxyribodipyrimidine photolyase
MKPVVNLFWLRRDLWLHDNAGLYHALKEGTLQFPSFIFDTNIWKSWKINRSNCTCTALRCQLGDTTALRN